MVGGGSLGYKMAGYKVLWANEFIPEAQKSKKFSSKGEVFGKGGNGI